MSNDNSRLCSRLGYVFNDPELLNVALSHRSVGARNNERLEFLGDSLLNFIIAEALYNKFPKAKEGELSRLRANLVQGSTLAELAKEMNLGDFLHLGEGELKSGGFRRHSILADAVEGVIGAIYTDSDFDTCRHIVISWFSSRLDATRLEDTNKDPKSRLQEYLQDKKQALPQYVIIETRGEAHAKEFVVECRLSSMKEACSGTSSSKRGAEKIAAEKMLALILNS